MRYIERFAPLASLPFAFPWPAHLGTMFEEIGRKLWRNGDRNEIPVLFRRITWGDAPCLCLEERQRMGFRTF